jgi:hypothetical protein
MMMFIYDAFYHLIKNPTNPTISSDLYQFMAMPASNDQKLWHINYPIASEPRRRKSM